MERLTQTTLPDCTALDAICAQVHMPIPEFLATCDAHKADCATCKAIAVADALLEVAEHELFGACTCTQTDVDMFDARGCESHDPNSPWNQRLRAVTAVQQYESMKTEVA